MLQLPQRAGARFTRIDIAEIARGAAAVRQRSKSSRQKADPVIKLVARYRSAVEQHKAAIADLKAFYASHDPMEVKPAAVYLPSLAVMLLHGGTQNFEFFSIPAITIWADEARKTYRAILRGRPRNGPSNLISRYNAKKHMADVNRLEPQLKRALRRRMKDVRQHWADSGYQSLVDRRHRTKLAMINARKTLIDARATSLAGVSAVLTLLQEQAWDEVAFKSIDGEMPPAGRKRILENLEKAIAVLMPEARKK